MSVYDPNWKYRPASETVKPGYLKRRFDAIRREQKERDAKAAQVVRPLIKAKVR